MKGTVPKRLKAGTVLKITVQGDGMIWTGRRPTRVIDFLYHVENWMVEKETGYLVNTVVLSGGKKIKTKSRKFPLFPSLPLG